MVQMAGEGRWGGVVRGGRDGLTGREVGTVRDLWWVRRD